jgi:hypothetical protein
MGGLVCVFLQIAGFLQLRRVAKLASDLLLFVVAHGRAGRCAEGDGAKGREGPRVEWTPLQLSWYRDIQRETNMRRLYTVEVMVIGKANVMVEAHDPDEARDKAEEATTPMHVTEWEYDADRILADTDQLVATTEEALPFLA